MFARFSTLILFAFLTATTALAQPAKLDTISYADLGKLVRADKGKVVLVYFWAHY